MPEYSVSSHSCGVLYPGYINGKHPSRHEGTVNTNVGLGFSKPQMGGLFKRGAGGPIWTAEMGPIWTAERGPIWTAERGPIWWAALWRLLFSFSSSRVDNYIDPSQLFKFLLHFFGHSTRPLNRSNFNTQSCTVLTLPPPPGMFLNVYL